MIWKFIYAASLRISGFIFDDFGKEYIITSPSSTDKKSYFIKSITKDGIIKIDNELERNNFSLKKGSYIIFKEVGGINELNDLHPRKIKYVLNNSFSIDEKLNYDNYTNGGIVEEYFLPQKIEFKKLRDIFDIPYIDNEPDIIDFNNEEGESTWPKIEERKTILIGECGSKIELENEPLLLSSTITNYTNPLNKVR